MDNLINIENESAERIRSVIETTRRNLGYTPNEIAQIVYDIKSLHKNMTLDTLRWELVIYEKHTLKYGRPLLSGAAMREQRLAWNFTAEEFSLLLGFSGKRQYVSNMENGQGKITRIISNYIRHMIMHGLPPDAPKGSKKPTRRPNKMRVPKDQ